MTLVTLVMFGIRMTCTELSDFFPLKLRKRVDTEVVVALVGVDRIVAYLVSLLFQNQTLKCHLEKIGGSLKYNNIVLSYC